MDHINPNEQKAHQVAATQGDIRDIKRDVEQVSKKVNDVHQALMGSELAQDGGMVKRLIDCEDELGNIRDKLETVERNNIKSNLYLRWLWAAAGGIVMAILSLLINHFSRVV